MFRQNSRAPTVKVGGCENGGQTAICRSQRPRQARQFDGKRFVEAGTARSPISITSIRSLLRPGSSRLAQGRHPLACRRLLGGSRHGLYVMDGKIRLARHFSLDRYRAACRDGEAGETRRMAARAGHLRRQAQGLRRAHLSQRPAAGNQGSVRRTHLAAWTSNCRSASARAAGCGSRAQSTMYAFTTRADPGTGGGGSAADTVQQIAAMMPDIAHARRRPTSCASVFSKRAAPQEMRQLALR